MGRMIRIVSPIAVAALLGGLAANAGLLAQARRKPIRLADATLIVEVNGAPGAEGDAGLQFFLDGEPWDTMKVFDPTGRVVLDVHTRGRLNGWGLTELFSETNEPAFDEVPLRRFKKRFPEGVYRFRGTDVEGRTLVGRATLSHDIPDAPSILSPGEGATVARTNLVADWAAPPAAPGIQIVEYRAIVEQESGPARHFEVELPASQTEVPIPSEFLESGTPYKFEIQAIDDSGNWTFSESTFRVA